MSTRKGENQNNDSLNDDFLQLDLGVIPEEEDPQEEGLTQEDKDALSEPDNEPGQEPESEEQKDGDEEYWEKFFSGKLDESEGEQQPEGESEEDTEEGQEPEGETEGEQPEGEQPDEDKKKEGTTEDGEADTPLHLHAAIMKERGLLPSSFDLNQVEGEDLQQQIESLADVIEQGYEDRYKNLKSNLDDLSKEVVDKIEQGFTEEEAKQSVVDRAKIENIDDETLENDQNMQEQLIRQYLQMSNVPEATIEKFIKTAKDSDSLYEESKDARENLPEIYKQRDEQEKQKREQEEQARQQRQQELVQQFDKKLEDSVGQEVFPGVKINKKDTEQIREALKPNYTIEKDGKKMSVTLEQKLKYEDPVNYYLVWSALANNGAFDKNADHKKVKQRQETNSTKKMADRIQSQQQKMKTKGGYKKTPSKRDDDKDASNSLPDFGSLGIR